MEKRCYREKTISERTDRIVRSERRNHRRVTHISMAGAGTGRGTGVAPERGGVEACCPGW